MPLRSPAADETPPYTGESRTYRLFLFSVLLTVILSLGGIFAGIAVQHSTLVHQELLERARTDFRNIVAVRAWNAGYGGVYVVKRPGVESSPYLSHPDLSTSDGRVLTLKNPATMTREISAQIDRRAGYSLHIASLKPVNPANTPDPFEVEALKAFDEGAREHYGFEDAVQGRRRSFRYMAPLYIEESCLECHATQGYRLGDVRGGISIRFDAAGFDQELRGNFILIVILALVTSIALTLLITYYCRRFFTQLRAARQQLEALATSDALTGLLNRRRLLELFTLETIRARRTGHDLACLLLDVDHFKGVNDRYGHLCGDHVLRHLSALLKGAVRPYDLFGRYGGEEFLLILPETNHHEALAIAERFRELVEHGGTPAELAGDLMVTVSIGVAQARAGDESDDLIRRADLALYRAKQNGRNRVELSGEET